MFNSKGSWWVRSSYYGMSISPYFHTSILYCWWLRGLRQTISALFSFCCLKQFPPTRFTHCYTSPTMQLQGIDRRSWFVVRKLDYFCRLQGESEPIAREKKMQCFRTDELQGNRSEVLSELWIVISISMEKTRLLSHMKICGLSWPTLIRYNFSFHCVIKPTIIIYFYFKLFHRHLFLCIFLFNV